MNLLILSILLCLHAVQATSVLFLNAEHSWIVFDIVNLITNILLSILVFRLISYKHQKSKLFAFLLLITLVTSIFAYTILSAVSYSVELYAACFFVLILPFIIWGALRTYDPNSSDKYSQDGSFLVYNNPRGIIGLITICLGFPGAGVSLVVLGQEFYFAQTVEGWQIAEKVHKKTPSKRYIQINDVSLVDARKLIGEKWQWRKNCLSTFTKYSNRKCPCPYL